MKAQVIWKGCTLEVKALDETNYKFEIRDSSGKILRTTEFEAEWPPMDRAEKALQSILFKEVCG